MAEETGANAPSQGPEQSLAAQYDVRQDEVATPGAAPDGVTVVGGQAKPDGAAPGAATPRDPETGRFVSQKAASEHLPEEGFGPAGAPAPQGRAPSPAHPYTLTRIAFDLGFSPEEIDALDTPTLSAAVRQAQQEQLAARHAQALDRGVAAGSERASQARQEASLARELGLADLGADEQGRPIEWDQSLLKVIKGLKDEVAALKAEHVRGQQRTARQQVEAVLARDYAQFMGPEPGPKATARDPGLAKRQVLAQYVSGALKDDPGSLEDRIHLAMEALFGQKRPEPSGHVRKPPAPAGADAPAPAPAPENGISEAQWREAALAAPTHRRGAAEPRGREAAINNLAHHLRENGLSQGAGSQQDLDEFPG